MSRLEQQFPQAKANKGNLGQAIVINSYVNPSGCILSLFPCISIFCSMPVTTNQTSFSPPGSAVPTIEGYKAGNWSDRKRVIGAHLIILLIIASGLNCHGVSVQEQLLCEVTAQHTGAVAASRGNQVLHVCRFSQLKEECWLGWLGFPQTCRQSQYCTLPFLFRSVCIYQSGCVLALPLVLFKPVSSNNHI